jgi:hypothetical protein
MPTIANNQVNGSGELTTTSAAFVDALCTSPALANGVEYFAIGICNHRNNGALYASEVEGRFGTTRLGLDRFRSPFGQFNLGDDGAGAAPMFLGIVTGDGSSTLNMRARGVDNAGNDIIVGSQTWLYFSLADLVANTDYHAAELLSESASVTPTGTTWVEGDASGQVQFTPSVTGDYWISASIEAVVATGAAATNEARARLVLVEDPAGAATTTVIGSGEQYHAISDAADTDHYIMILGEMDVRALTGGTTYEIRWEVSNVAANNAISYRREKVFAFARSRFRNSSYITNAGGIVATTSETEATNALTFDFSGSGGDVLVFASAGYQNDGTWGDTWLRRDGTPDVDFPGAATAGRFHAAIATDYTGDIITIQQGARVAAVAASETFRLVAQADGPDGLTYGRTRNNAGNGRALLIALEMYATEVAHELSGDVAGGMEASATGGAVESLFGAVGVDMASAATGALAFGLVADPAGAMESSATGVAVFPLVADVVGAMEAAATGGAVEALSAAATGGMEAAATGLIGFGLVADATGGMDAAATGIAVPDLDDLVGAAGSELELSVMGVDQYGVLQPRVGDPRPVRFELLDASGSAVDHDVIESITVQVRRASGSPGSVATLTPTAETESGIGDAIYTWAVDISETVTVAGMWILEADVVLVDGRRATWPSAGPLRIRALEVVG